MAERILTTEEVSNIRARVWQVYPYHPTPNEMEQLCDSVEALRAERDRLVQTVIEYLDNRPDDELGMKRQWDKFYPIARKLELILGVEEGRWG